MSEKGKIRKLVAKLKGVDELLKTYSKALWSLKDELEEDLESDSLGTAIEVLVTLQVALAESLVLLKEIGLTKSEEKEIEKIVRELINESVDLSYHLGKKDLLEAKNSLSKMEDNLIKLTRYLLCEK